MNYNEAIEYIHSINRFGMNLGLDRIKNLLDRLGNPQDELKFVHIAGTNGKGSVTSIISQVMLESGYKVGMYTSPYLERFNERIRINGREVDDEVLARMTTKVRRVCDEIVEEGGDHPTEFEVVTAVGFLCFLEEGCEIVCLEVGLGGRFDATNCIKEAEVSVITSISKDHMDVLGDNLSKIAFERAGIVKEDGDVFLYDVGSEEVFEAVEDVCKLKNARLRLVEFNSIEIKKSNLFNQIFSFRTSNGDIVEDIKIRLAGIHQIKNAILAYEVLDFLRDKKGYSIEEDSIREGFKNCRWAGRMEVLKESPLVLIDGAHNYDSAKILSSEIERLVDDTYHKILVIGVLKDKEVDKIIREIAPKFDKIVVTLPDNPRAMKVEELAYRIGMYNNDIICIEDCESAYDYAFSLDISDMEQRGNNKSKKQPRSKNKVRNKKLNNVSNDNKKQKKMIMICGSLYLVGKLRKKIV